jgi:hypothetical protein
MVLPENINFVDVKVRRQVIATCTEIERVCCGGAKDSKLLPSILVIYGKPRARWKL